MTTTRCCTRRAVSTRRCRPPAGPRRIDLGAIARAEKALAALAVEFSAWMKNEIKVLDAARDILRERGVDEDTHAALFRAAHDIKGEAATFGYPIAGMIAGSLCRLMDDSPTSPPLPLLVVDQHVDADPRHRAPGGQGRHRRDGAGPRPPARRARRPAASTRRRRRRPLAARACLRRGSVLRRADARRRPALHPRRDDRPARVLRHDLRPLQSRPGRLHRRLSRRPMASARSACPMPTAPRRRSSPPSARPTAAASACPAISTSCRSPARPGPRRPSRPRLADGPPLWARHLRHEGLRRAPRWPWCPTSRPASSRRPSTSASPMTRRSPASAASTPSAASAMPCRCRHRLHRRRADLDAGRRRPEIAGELHHHGHRPPGPFLDAGARRQCLAWRRPQSSPRLDRIADELRERGDPSGRFDPAYSTVQAGLIEAGEAVNIVPSRAVDHLGVPRRARSAARRGARAHPPLRPRGGRAEAPPDRARGLRHHRARRHRARSRARIPARPPRASPCGLPARTAPSRCPTAPRPAISRRAACRR